MVEGQYFQVNEDGTLGFVEDADPLEELAELQLNYRLINTFMHHLGRLRPGPFEPDCADVIQDLNDHYSIAKVTLGADAEFSIYLQRKNGELTVYCHNTDRTFSVGLHDIAMLAVWRGISNTDVPVVNLSTKSYSYVSEDDSDSDGDDEED